MKILIALQFWAGDRGASIRLAKFLADLETTHSNEADLLLVNRFDCKPLQPDTIRLLSRKFNVYTYQTRARVTGWPHGCNAMWISTIEWVRSMSYGGKTPNYKAIFTCEGDGAPVYQNWIARLHAAWDRVDSLGSITIAGHVVGGPGTDIFAHVNGNAMISGQKKKLDWTLRTASSVHPNVGWDYALRDEFPKVGQADLPEIRSYYNSPTFSQEQYDKMRSDQLAWVHGDKSGCLVAYGRKTYGL